MRLLLIRHGRMAGDPFIEQEIPVSGCLAEVGIEQAKKLNNMLKSTHIDYAFSSSYGRAIQTAQIALEGHNECAPIKIVKNFHEWNPSDYYRYATSTEAEAIAKRDAERDIGETWKTELGEGLFDMYARVVPALLETLTEVGWKPTGICGFVPTEEAKDKTVAIFAHGGSLSVMLSFLLGLSPSPMGRFSLPLTGCAHIEFNERKGIYYPSLFLPTPYEV
jgi:broad specificity phosphatase PhoE